MYIDLSDRVRCLRIVINRHFFSDSWIKVLKKEGLFSLFSEETTSMQKKPVYSILYLTFY